MRFEETRSGPGSALGQQRADLALDRHRLRIVSDDPGLLADALSVLVPPCHDEPASGNRDDAWLIDVRLGTDRSMTGMADGLPVLTWPGSGRKLVVRHSGGGQVSVAGTYGNQARTTLIDADAAARRTRVRVPAGDVPSRRWPDWLARMFFGSRLLADGWALLHAAAVRIGTGDGARVLLILAGQRGGKSTLAYRACTELGAALMGDDLVLVRSEANAVWVIGWPTRICVPAEVLSGGLPGSVPANLMPGHKRSRLILSPAECERLLGITRAGPARLAAIICISPDACAPPGGAATLMSSRHLDAVADASAKVPAQRVMMADVLGLVGTAASGVGGAAGPPAPWHQVLAGVPAVAVSVADMARLPALRVWDLALRFIPWLGNVS